MDSSTYGLSALLLADITGVHLETAKRWKRLGRMPARYAPIVALRTEGDLGVIAGNWQGWRLKGKQLWTPEDVAITAGDIRAIPYQRALVSELKLQLAEPQQWKLL